MGKTTRWLKGIFGMKSSTKDQKEPGNINSNSGDRKMSSFGKSGRDSGTGGRRLCNNPATVPPNISPSEAAWLRSYYLESDKEQSKHAIAVAAATAAAADAAVTAAQAAVAVVRLTRHGHGTMFAAGGNSGRVKWAAVKIQTTFRGYLKEIFDDTSCEHKASIHSRRLSASSFESKNINPTIEDIPKIVEVDPGRPRSSKGWRPNFLEPRPEYGEHDPFYPARPENEWGLMGDHEYRASTAQSTPRFINTGGPNPSKSVCGDNNSYNFFGQYDNYHIAHPNYMANTMSFRAKLRSQSAPKQRVEPGYSKKRLSLNEMMESRNSLSGVGMQRSCCRVQEAISFKNVVMGKLDRSYEFGREVERYHLQRKY